MSTTASPQPKPPIEILIAEDSATQRAQLQHLLEQHDYAVVAAVNGKEALAAARRCRPTLIISDIVMPELDGYGLCKAVKTDDKLKDVPVILLTTLADPHDILKALECGADNFVRKPYEERYLLSRIDYMLMGLEMRKNQKMHTGVELTLDNQTHFISTERQQVLDMLISTYEQAVAINAELKQREKELTQSNQSLSAMHKNLERLVAERTDALRAEVAERKRAEDEVRTLNADLERRVAERTQQLEAASRAKSDFLANMSHELRTPLNAIIGFSEMLKDGVLGELESKQKGFVTDIFDAGSHLLSLINDILDLSKIEAGMLQLEPQAVNVAALLKASTLVVREKAAAHRIRLDTQLDPALGTMLADERALKQIVYNLLSNAVKFTPEGGTATLSARRCARAEVALGDTLPGRLIALPEGEHGEFLAIAVEDTGVGIAEEHLPKLFQPFTQVDSSATRREGGTGLGLSLVRRLADLHGGTVGVASRTGAGSRFCVWLPYREVAAGVQKGQTVPEATVASAPALPLALVIEDDDRIADLITAQLRAEGFDVMRAATAEEGLVRAAKRAPQLITLDIFLPAMDGWEFMRRLNADPKLADTPVVIISISDDPDRGLALGARRVLQKPFAREQLVAALAGLVDARPDGAPARVLVVDDNAMAVELLATALEAEGYRVLRAYGGAEAIEAARSKLPDLLILDLMMPEVSGFEVARALADSEQTARIPILVFTAKDLSAEDRTRLDGRVSTILAKAGFNENALLAELRRALPKRAGH